MPKVSVVIPTFNRAGFLQAAISSVLNQTYQDFEIIVVDDASTDNTGDLVSAFKEGRINYIRHESNRGEACSRNTGILNARGEYIAFLDDDDEWLPEKLITQLRILENAPSTVGLIYSSFLFFDKESRKKVGEKGSAKKGFVYLEILKRNFIGTPSTVMARRECVKKIGFFDENISYGLDYDYWIRLSRHYDFEYVDLPLVKYQLHNNRLSTNPEIKIRGIEDMINKYGKKMVLANKYYRNSFLTIGIEFCNQGKMKKGRKALLKAIQLNPFRVNPYFYFGISLLNHKNYLRLKKLKENAVARIRALKKI